jgi:hypothetical protein
VKVTRQHRLRWIHFAISATTMLTLGGCTVWRAAVTAWRPIPDRLYFFPNDNWLGRIDHSWLNDFLLGLGTIACFFVVFTALYAADGLLHGDSPSILDSNRTASNPSACSDHKRLMKIILYGLLVRALIEGWGEEVGLFGSPLIFDPWDLTVELAGVILGAWLVHTLSYPLFSTAPHFAPDPDFPGLQDLIARFGVDILSVMATGFYIGLVDPFELSPLTLSERQILSLEVALVFVTFRAGLKRGMNPDPFYLTTAPLTTAH